MSTLSRITFAGFACLCVSAVALPSFADGEARGGCVPTWDVCPQTQPALKVGLDCMVTVPDILSMATATPTCTQPAGTLLTYQTPEPGEVVPSNGSSFLRITLVAQECFGEFRDACGNPAYCDVFIPLEYTFQCANSPRTLSANDECQAVVPDLTGEVVAPNCCNYEEHSERSTRADCCGTIRVSQYPEPGTVIGLGKTDVSLIVERCYSAYCCGKASPPRAEDDCYCSDLIGSCVVELHVVDDTPPTIENCPADVTLGADLSCLGIVPDLTVPDVEGLVVTGDNCTPAEEIVITQDPPAGAEIGLGTTEVTITATDSAGNGATCTVVVFLEENGCLAPPAPQPLGCDPNNQSLNLLMSFLVHAPVCGATCPVIAVLTICGLVAMKRRRRR